MTRRSCLVILVLSASALASCGGDSSATSSTAVREHSSSTASTLVVAGSTSEASPTDSAEADRVNKTTSGTISRDETWRDEIHITGDVWLADGATLTIDPGTTVYLASLSDDQRCCSGDYDDEYTRSNNDPTRLEEWGMRTILIDGRGGVIRAIGTLEAPIVFRPTGDNTSPAQWDGVYVERGTIQHAVLLYGGHTPIQAVGGSGDALGFEPTIEIAYNEVRHFLWAGIDAHTPDVWIHHNIVEGGGHQGIGARDNSLVEHNIVLNAQTGIAVENGNGVIVRNNLVIDSVRGMELRSGHDIQVTNNTVARVDGPPTGWYFEGDLVYPAFEIGGGIESYLQSSGIEILNNVVYGPFDWGVGLHQELGPASEVDYNLMWGQPSGYAGRGWGGAGPHLLAEDPRFVDPAVGDFHLMGDSPAIDTGSPSVSDSDGSISDLGAYGGPGGGGW